MDGKRRKLQVIGTGSFLPSTVVDNATLMRYMIGDIGKSDDYPLKKFGIETRRLDFDFTTQTKPEGLTDLDLAEWALRKALEDAKQKPDFLDHLIYVTCTPNTIHFMDPVIQLKRRLGLGREVKIHMIDSGCAGLACAFETAATYMEAGHSRHIAVVASNLPSGYIPHYIKYVKGHDTRRLYLSALIFGDGASAIIFSEEFDESGLVDCFYETDGNYPLVDYLVGGSQNPTDTNNIGDHNYFMRPEEIKEQFPLVMQRNFEIIQRRCRFNLEEIKRFYLHQANRKFIEMVADAAGIPRERVPINIDRYGNTSAASTLILFDEDRKSGIVKVGNLILFLWVGAGLMNGGALLRI